MTAGAPDFGPGLFSWLLVRNLHEATRPFTPAFDGPWRNAGQRSRITLSLHPGYDFTDQPSINNPMAAIQLPQMRTARRAHWARSTATCPATSDTTANSGHAMPTMARRAPVVAARSGRCRSRAGLLGPRDGEAARRAASAGRRHQRTDECRQRRHEPRRRGREADRKTRRHAGEPGGRQRRQHQAPRAGAAQAGQQRHGDAAANPRARSADAPGRRRTGRSRCSSNAPARVCRPIPAAPRPAKAACPFHISASHRNTGP